MIPRIRPWANYPSLLQAIRTGQVEDRARFEQEFAASVGAEHAVATNMGRGALQAGLLALNVTPNSEVIVPALACNAVVDAVLAVGAKPVPADVNLFDFNLSVDSAKAAMGDQTRAVIAVHTYGFPCDITVLKEICTKRGIGLIEDCAQSVGARVENRPVGTFGDVGIFSFAFDKILSFASGGIALSDDSEVDRRIREIVPRRPGSSRSETAHLLRFMRLHAMFSPKIYAVSRHLHAEIEALEWPRDEVRAPLGSLRSAMGRYLLTRSLKIFGTYRRNASILSELLAVPGIEIPEERTGTEAVPLRLTIRVPAALRNQLSTHLLQHGFEVVPAAYDRPVHQLSEFRGLLRLKVDLSGAAVASRTLLNFPVHPYISESGLEEMGNLVRSFVAAA